MKPVHYTWGKLLVLAAMVLTWLAGGRVIDRIVGQPTADEQLIVAASASDQRAFDDALADGASPTGRDPQGTTALMICACTGSVERTRQLLDRGADVNALDQWGRTPLMYAARCNQVEVIQLLLSHGADATRRNHVGQSARDEAVAFGCQDAVALLDRLVRVPTTGRTPPKTTMPPRDPLPGVEASYDSTCAISSPLA